MRIITHYPDFAFAIETQVILFFINAIVTALSYYWCVSLLLHIIQKKVEFKQKLKFSFMAAILLNILVVYGVSWINGIMTGVGKLHIGKFEILTKNVLPVAYFFLYILGIRILNLSPVKSIMFMRFSYIYYLTCTLCLRIVSLSFALSSRGDPRGWNYLSDILKLVGGTILIYIIYRIILFVLNHYKLDGIFPDNITVKNVSHELIKNFLICCLFYVLVTGIYYHPYFDVLHCVLLLLLLLSYLSIALLFELNQIQQQNLTNRDEHIAALNSSIEEFRGVKHDFNNVLQTYSGYLSLGAYDKLKLYHAKMVNTTLYAEHYLSLSSRLSENPAFFSLFIQKLDYAKKLGITFETGAICNLKENYLDELEFSRIMSVLLDNAIEAAEKTSQKLISFSVQRKLDNSKLFILSNDTNDDVDVEKILQPGFTTKQGHMGQGLAQVRNTLNKYGNATLNFSSYKNTFTAYLELKPLQHT